MLAAGFCREPNPVFVVFLLKKNKIFLLSLTKLSSSGKILRFFPLNPLFGRDKENNMEEKCRQ